MDDDKITDLKLALNNLIWIYSPPELTIKQAENIACDCLCMIKKGTDAGQTVKDREPDFC